MGVFLLNIFVLGLSELATHGILGDGIFFFLGLIYSDTMLLSPKAGIIAIVLDILACIIFA